MGEGVERSETDEVSLCLMNIEKFGRFSCENLFYYIRVVEGADPYR